MDEHRLAELLRDAVREAPPASFDARDVLVAGQRQKVRRRGLIVGAAAATAVLAAGLAIGFVSDEQAGGTSVQAATTRPGPGAQPQPALTPYAGQNFGSAQADGSPGECGSTDARLATALAAELPAADHPNPTPVDFPCPDGSSSAAYLVRDGSTVGLVAVVLVPSRDAATALVRPPHSVEASAPTAGGGMLVTVSEPAVGSATAPFSDRVGEIARLVADRV